MKIYTTDSEGFIIGIKEVGNKYIIGFNDFEGEPQFEIGYHYQTGIEKPLTDEEIKCEALSHLKKELDEAIRFNNTVEIGRCQQAYLDINNGIGCKTKAEIEQEKELALEDANKWFGYAMNQKGWW